jgi:hypothetical protein
MPETTVYEHHYPVSWKHQIGFSGESGDVKPITVTQRVKSPPNLQFGSRVLAADRSHITAPLFGGVDISHK